MVTKRILDIETNEIADIPLSALELAAFQEQKLESERKMQEWEEILQKRFSALAKLAALGLTADDLKALGLGGN